VTLFYELLCLVGPDAGLIRRASDARANRDFTAAAQLYAQACKAMPGHFRLWVQQGNMAKDAALFNQARQAYEAARRLRGDDADLHLQLGHLCKLTGDMVGAAHAYCVSLSCEPDHADAYRELAAIGYVDVADRIKANACR
jgi:predicted TPR repeat methyltransferase